MTTSNLHSSEATATIADLRRWVEQIRQRELERLFNRLALDEQAQTLVAVMSCQLVNNILHEPTLALNQENAKGNGAACVALIRHLFALDNSSG